jgi:hypothetical protein
MKSPVPLLRMLEALENRLVLVELLLLYADVDLDDVLPDNPTGADVEMADLRVAHEAVRKADGETMGGDGAVRVVFRDLVHVCRVTREDRVAFHFLLRRNTPAIVHTTHVVRHEARIS